MTEPSMLPLDTDVLVIGGGPAGCTAATLLAHQGHRCLVVERARFPRYHIGESLIPQTYATLDRLGLLPAMKASSFPEKHSVRFVAPSGTESDPFYFNETVPGDGSRTWQVDRATFDQLCLDNARSAGVQVVEGTGARQVLFDGDRAVGARVADDTGKEVDIRARVVVDASGFATLMGRQLDLRGPVPGLDKGTAWSYWRGGRRGDGLDAGETTIFLIPERGWFWYIPLPDDIVSVGVVASPDYLFDEGDDMEAIYAREVGRCRPLAERLQGAEQVEPVRGAPHLAYLNRQTCGDGWVMIGDARAFLDPIYSSGLFLALGSAELAADCIHDALQHDDPSAARLGAFEADLTRGVDVIRRLIHAFYDSSFSFGAFVERFPDQRAALVDCLVGDVVEKDMSGFIAALAEMTPPPPTSASASVS
ncbi:MAG TPA: NAD(P)/FAD-dependent oxidoreductase [Acidobacteriota bacterium]|nr:NAD(P)/FAD-dependent oxidoreductase [Acidobacteriota bacterium]